GVGFFVLRILAALRQKAGRRYEALRYQILDLSQVLQDSQRMLHFGDAKVRYILGNASRSLPFRDASLDLVLSNEVIADFETVRLRRADLYAQERARPDANGAASVSGPGAEIERTL